MPTPPRLPACPAARPRIRALPGNTTTLDGPIYGPAPGAFDLLSVKEIVASCERGLVVVLDRNMAVLGRVWPLYEVCVRAHTLHAMHGCALSDASCGGRLCSVQ